MIVSYSVTKNGFVIKEFNRFSEATKAYSSAVWYAKAGDVLTLTALDVPEDLHPDATTRTILIDRTIV